MIAVGIDTSTRAGSVGLAGPRGLHAELKLHSRVTHSERLLPTLRSLLDKSGLEPGQLDLFAVASGPGSFTGLRIGMATAKGLALASSRPVVGFSTLETLAVACAETLGTNRPRVVCVMLDAGRSEVYRGLFRCQGGQIDAVDPEAAMAPRRAAKGLPGGCVVCGDGLASYRDQIEPLLPATVITLDAQPSIGALLARRALDLVQRSGLHDLPPLSPNYLRVSDAEKSFRS